jgi:hypothetical protein
MSATTSVIVAGARTPVGKLLGSLKDFSATDLGGLAIKAALERAGVAPEQVQYVIMGQVLTAGAGQIPARQAAHKAGIPLTVPALTVNKVCLSGISAIALADQLIRAGEFEVVVAGGQESMTQAPHLLPKSREGFKYGTVEMTDHMAYDGLWDAFTDQAMGGLTEAANTGPSRTPTPPAATSRRPRAGRTASTTTRWCRCRSRSERVSRWSSAMTRAFEVTPTSRRWPGCVRPSARTAPSPRARPRRSPTVPPQSW